MKKDTILILCTGNSCRSHIAEGFLKQSLGDVLDIQSAGAKPSGYVHPVAIEVMTELGIDISDHKSKHLDQFIENDVHTVITVCGNAEDCCPQFKGEVEHHHWGFEDPADATGTDEEIRAEFARIRDQIKSRFDAFADEIKQSGLHA